MIVYGPDDKVDGTKLRIQTSVFLAGGITNCDNWQEEVIGFLREFEKAGIYPRLVNSAIFNPRRDSFDTKDKQATIDQIKWEHKWLKKCDIFSVFFAKSESVQPIALYEFGKWGNTNNSIITVENGYKRTEDVVIQGALDGLWVDVIPESRSTFEHARKIAHAIQKM